MFYFTVAARSVIPGCGRVAISNSLPLSSDAHAKAASSRLIAGRGSVHATHTADHADLSQVRDCRVRIAPVRMIEEIRRRQLPAQTRAASEKVKFLKNPTCHTFTPGPFDHALGGRCRTGPPAVRQMPPGRTSGSRRADRREIGVAQMIGPNSRDVRPACGRL